MIRISYGRGSYNHRVMSFPKQISKVFWLLPRVLLGVIIGVLINWKLATQVCEPGVDAIDFEVGLIPPVAFRKPLYIGVMTAEKLLHTRAVTIQDTWGQYAPKMDFYIAANRTESLKDLPVSVIGLHGISDGYPPLKKFFRMLQYIAEHYIDKYNWFMRADDDCYVRVPQLMSFLNQLDPTELLYIGAPGQGRPVDLEKIKLFTHELYCLGGPGTIFSRSLLKQLAPHLNECLSEATSHHDDVEVGKCISRRLAVQCTSSDEVCIIITLG